MGLGSGGDVPVSCQQAGVVVTGGFRGGGNFLKFVLVIYHRRIHHYFSLHKVTDR